MVAPCCLSRLRIDLNERRIIPPLNGVDVKPISRIGIALETGQERGKILLGDLQFIGDGYAVAVIPNGDNGRGAQHADGVDRFPEQTFGAGGVADGAEGDFVAAAREVRHLL